MCIRDRWQVDGKSRGILNDEELTILLCHSSIYRYPRWEVGKIQVISEPVLVNGRRLRESVPAQPAGCWRSQLAV